MYVQCALKGSKLIQHQAFISYFLQLFIVTAAWVMLRFFQSWIRLPLLIYYTIRHGLRHGWRRTAKRHALLKSSSQYAALLTSMVELQKAQCFFMLAIHSAALLLLDDPERLLTVTSYQQLLNNLDLMRLLTTAGSLPLVFGLLTLHLSHMKSSFIYCLTLLTFSFSSATGLEVNKWDVKPSDIKSFNDNFSPCGGNATPEKYCAHAGALFPGNNQAGYFTWHNYDFIYSIAVFILLFFNQFPVVRISSGCERAKWMPVFEWARLQIPSTPGCQLLDELRRGNHLIDFLVRAIINVWIFLLQTFGIRLFIRHGTIVYYDAMKYLGRVTPDERYGGAWATSNILETISDSEWDFGQIIAITVLMPSIIEYAYLALRKFVF